MEEARADVSVGLDFVGGASREVVVSGMVQVEISVAFYVLCGVWRFVFCR